MSWAAAALLVCSTADPVVIATVAQQAEESLVDPALALAVACMESGIKGKNPMGVLSCYPRNDSGKFDQFACIAIGVQSLKNRLRCGSERCALRGYNNSKNKENYAKRGSHIAKVMRRSR